MKKHFSVYDHWWVKMFWLFFLIHPSSSRPSLRSVLCWTLRTTLRGLSVCVCDFCLWPDSSMVPDGHGVKSANCRDSRLATWLLRALPAPSWFWVAQGWPQDFPFFPAVHPDSGLEKDKKASVLVFQGSQSSAFLCHHPLSLKKWQEYIKFGDQFYLCQASPNAFHTSIF